MINKKGTLSILTALVLSATVSANEAGELDALKQEVKELREITQSLIDETSDLKSGFNYTTVDSDKSYSGLSSAASKVYYSKSPLSIGGYGEMYFSSQRGDSADKKTLDVYKFVPYIGYKFSDNIILNTELEFEHGGAAPSSNGEVVVEFMYLDFLIDKNYNFRIGNFLIPMGLINERHEPTLFTTVQRPNTSKYIIPTTWNEGGVMVYGDIIEGLSYKFIASSALKTGVNGSTWLRDGRGGAFKQTDPGLGFTARIDYTRTNGLLLGTSVYYAPSEDTTTSTTTIQDVHLDYKKNGARIYATYAIVKRSKAKEIALNAVEKAYGGYINFSYDFLTLSNSSYSLPIFIQYEELNPEDLRADKTEGETTRTTTLGLNFFPHEQVVLKLDYAMQTVGSVKDNIASLSMGFIF